ncbi:hypothetical protein JCM10908_004535 [Rhodotorula pacifica]|uniref:uncharacterized protein n=1 Tax=Rhodotorula pacifica TaxID=1495444 RepID=UPI003178D7EC
MSFDPPRPYRPHLASPTSYDSLRAPPSIATWSDASLSSLDQQSKERSSYAGAPSPLQRYTPPPPPHSASGSSIGGAPLPATYYDHPQSSQNTRQGRPSTLQKQPPPRQSSMQAGYGPQRPPPVGQFAPNGQQQIPLQQQQHALVHEKPGLYSVKMGGTGVIARKESSARKAKRITLMLISGVIVCGIIALIVLGCKKML